MNVLSASLGGIRSAERQLTGSANDLASASVPGANVDLAAEVVGLGMAQIQEQASVAVARTASQTIGTLVNMFA